MDFYCLFLCLCKCSLSCLENLSLTLKYSKTGAGKRECGFPLLDFDMMLTFFLCNHMNLDAVWLLFMIPGFL